MNRVLGYHSALGIAHISGCRTHHEICDVHMQSRGEEQRSISERPKQQELLHRILLPRLFHHSSTFHDYEKYMSTVAGTVLNNHAAGSVGRRPTT
jgi:hypothetical protein